MCVVSRAGALDAYTCVKLVELIDEGDREVARAFLKYESCKDVYVLIESLKSCARGGGDEGDSDNDDNDDDTEDGSEGEGGVEDEGEGRGFLDEDEREAIETRFLNIIQNMNLSHLETAALRLAIARNDPAIRGALEGFRSTQDTEALKRSLRDVAQKTISETLSDAGYDGVEGEEEGEGRQQSDDDDDGEEGGDHYGEDEGDNDDEQEGGEEEAERGLMSTQAAREYIFPILIAELVKENVLNAGQGSALRSLFQKGDAVVNAALDVYDLDSDMAELVDTLQRVVATASEQ